MKTGLKLLLLIIFSLVVMPNFTSACIDDDSDGYCIDLVTPNGGDFKTGDIVSISWTQKNISLVNIGYKTCPSCLDWINFTLNVDPNIEHHTYVWIIPQVLEGKNVSIQLTGYLVGTGSETDNSAEFQISKNVNQIDVGLIEVVYTDKNPKRYVPFVVVYNVFNKGDFQITTDQLVFKTTIGSKTKELNIPVIYTIPPKTSLYLYTKMMFDDEFGTFDVRHSIEGKNSR